MCTQLPAWPHCFEPASSATKPHERIFLIDMLRGSSPNESKKCLRVPMTELPSALRILMQMSIRTAGLCVKPSIRSHTWLQVRPGRRCMICQRYAGQLILLDVRTLISVVIVIDVMKMFIKTVGICVKANTDLHA